mmetsp:Transcript_74118/g.116011  ORF Transcript_74118/g.116011 Transcript_74118/m.116011 type:complete len:212 (-) Transcript_74118:299-934(-)
MAKTAALGETALCMKKYRSPDTKMLFLRLLTSLRKFEVAQPPRQKRSGRVLPKPKAKTYRSLRIVGLWLATFQAMHSLKYVFLRLWVQVMVVLLRLLTLKTQVLWERASLRQLEKAEAAYIVLSGKVCRRQGQVIMKLLPRGWILQLSNLGREEGLCCGRRILHVLIWIGTRGCWALAITMRNRLRVVLVEFSIRRRGAMFIHAISLILRT